MTAITGGRVNATVNNMPTKVVPAMWHAAVIFSLVFDGGSQLDIDPVAIAAKTSPVTAGTDTVESTGHLPVVFDKKHTVIEFFIGNLCFLHIVAIGAITKIFPLFFRVPWRRCIATLNGCTGNHKYDRQNNNA
jgi:hypothetical protein